MQDSISYPPHMNSKNYLIGGQFEAEHEADHSQLEYHATYLSNRQKEPIKSLSGPQSEVENPLEHQEGTDGLVSVKLAAPPPPMMVVVKPVAHGLGINPEGE